MSKSKIVLAVIAGFAIGGAVAILLKAGKVIDELADEEDQETQGETSHLTKIAEQFSDKLSSHFEKAEAKLMSAKKKDPSLIVPDGEFGIFL